MCLWRPPFSSQVAHGRTYATVEEAARRLAVFAANLAWIEGHNAAVAAGGPGAPTWTAGVNQFADLTW